jgi:HNH endonuclease
MLIEPRFTNKYAMDADTGCWVWIAATDKHGYGLFTKPAAIWKPGTARHWMAHRYCYEMHRGPIPEGLVLDHLCRNTSCVNPDHLEAVTHGENLRRGAGTGMDLWDGSPPGVKAKSLMTTCAYGHEYTEANTYRRPGTTWRQCRKCINDAVWRYEQRKRAS